MHQMGVIFNPLLLVLAVYAISFADSGKYDTPKQGKGPLYYFHRRNMKFRIVNLSWAFLYS